VKALRHFSIGLKSELASNVTRRQFVPRSASVVKLATKGKSFGSNLNLIGKGSVSHWQDGSFIRDSLVIKYLLTLWFGVRVNAWVRDLYEDLSGTSTIGRLYFIKFTELVSDCLLKEDLRRGLVERLDDWVDKIPFVNWSLKEFRKRGSCCPYKKH